MKRFLGLVQFYSEYVPHLGSLAADLYVLSLKDPIVPLEAHLRSFLEIKRIISTKVILSYPHWDKTFIISKGIAGVLQQENDQQLRPISFYSRKLCDRERKLQSLKSLL